MQAGEAAVHRKTQCSRTSLKWRKDISRKCGRGMCGAKLAIQFVAISLTKISLEVGEADHCNQVLACVPDITVFI